MHFCLEDSIRNIDYDWFEIISILYLLENFFNQVRQLYSFISQLKIKFKLSLNDNPWTSPNLFNFEIANFLQI